MPTKLSVISRESLPPNLQRSVVKQYLREYDTEQDSVIDLLIDGAVEFAQTYTRQTFRKTTYQLETESQPIVLPRFPVISVESIEFTNANGDFDSVADPGKFELTCKTPPTLKGDSLSSPIRVQWIAGLDTDEDWPADLIILLWQMVEENWQNRKATPDKPVAVNFSRKFQLSLEQYATHHDAVR